LISPPGGGDCVDAWLDLAWQAGKKELGTGNTHGRALRWPCMMTEDAL
jgi:hypothetical protein